MVRLRKFNPDFWTEAKFYLVGPKIILMALYSIFLQTNNSTFPPLEFSTQAVPLLSMVNKINSIPTLSSTGNYPKLYYPISMN